MEPLLSVHIVADSPAATLRRAVSSVLESTTVPFVVYLWSGTQDNAVVTYLEELLERDCRVHVVWDSDDLGFGFAHNALAKLSGSPYICILGSDIEVPGGWHDVPIRALMADPRIGAFGCSGVSRCWDAVGLTDGCILTRKSDAQLFGPFDIAALSHPHYLIQDFCARLRRHSRRLASADISGLRLLTGEEVLRTQSVQRDPPGVRAANHLRFRRRWSAPSGPRRILIRNLGLLGDNICAMPAVRAIRRRFPEFPLWIASRTPSVWLDNPDVDGICSDPNDWSPDDLVFSMRKHSEHSRSEHLVDLLMREVQVPGFDGWQRLEPPLNSAEIPEKVKINIPALTREWAYGKTVHLGRFAVLCADATWHIRRWPHSALFAEAMFKEFGCEVIHLSERRESELLGAYDWRGMTTLQQAAAVIERATVVVSVDTGLLHVAGSLDVPTIGLFGPTVAKSRLHTGQIDVSSELECSGCFRLARGAYQTCARDTVQSRPSQPFAECMQTVSIDAVLRKVKYVWPTY